MSASGKSRNRRSEYYRGYFGTGGNGPYHDEGARDRAEHDRLLAARQEAVAELEAPAEEEKP